MLRLAQVLMEALPDGLVTVEERGRITFVNPAVTRLFGYTADELVGQPIEILVPEAQRSAHATVREQFQQAPHLREMGAARELFGVRKDGSTFPVEIMLSPVTGDDRASIVAIVRDISRRHLAEQESRMWRRAVDQAQTGIAVVDGVSDRVLAANPAFARMHGYELSEVVGLAAAAMVPRGEFDQQAAFDKVRAAGHGLFRYMRQRRDGSTFPALVDLSAMPGTGPPPNGIMLVQDMSDDLREQADRDRLIRESQAALAAREELVAIASHDIRSPLAGIRLQLQNVGQKVRKTEGAVPATWVQERLDNINESLDHVFGLLENLLDRHRREAGVLEFRREHVDLGDIVRRISRRMEPQFQQIESTLQVHADGGATGEWDRMRLEQVVTNLLSNALRYGAGAPVAVTVDSTDDRVDLVIADSGPGMDPEMVSQLFDRGTSEGGRGRYGLGLWIAKRIIDLHDGTITVHSKLGGGTQFTVSLPRSP